MRILTLSGHSLEIITDQIVAELSADRLIIVPFDTVYGIIGRVNERVAQYIYAVKNRDFSKPLGLALPTTEKLDDLFQLDEDQKSFVADKIPGAYTFILKQPGGLLLPSQTTVNNKVGVRVPDSRLIRSIGLRLNEPILQTSANRSGQPPATTLAQVLIQFNHTNDISLVVDGGEIKNGRPSEIFDLTQKPYRRIERS